MIELTLSREHVLSISQGFRSLSMLSINATCVYLFSVKQNTAERERESIKEEVLDDVLILYTRREYILHMCIYAHTLRTRDS